ncbi:MAG: hypothetical protein K0S09_1312 [Sphingobacteriaceae bacterium]|nr:hypothetical protein [Sphingobacteriaceae bacterium]
MKRIMILCAVVLGFTAMTAMQTDNTPEFKFEKETHDFGKIPQGKPVTVELAFTNIGEQPLIISAVEPTCGCTIADYTKTPVLKGKSGSIKLTYSAAAPGAFTKGITVKSNAKTPVKVLYIKGEVVPSTAPASSSK